jgi:hypothetical protein
MYQGIVGCFVFAESLVLVEGEHCYSPGFLVDDCFAHDAVFLVFDYVSEFDGFGWFLFGFDHG